MIKAGNAPLASGKTYQTSQFAINNLEVGLSTLILEPTLAAMDEVLGMVKSAGLPTGFAISLRGKSPSTCHKRYLKRTCSTCPLFEKYGNPESTSRVTMIEQLIPRIAKQALTLDLLAIIATDFEICPTMLSRTLSTVEVPHITIATHAYLGSGAPMDVLEQVKRNCLVIDEGDQLWETLLSNQQRRISLMKPRQSQAHTIRGACNRNCESCFPHMADDNSTTFRPYEGRVGTPASMSDFQNSIDHVEDLCSTIERAVNGGIIKDWFDFEAVREFVRNLQKVLPPFKSGQATIDYLAALKKIQKKNDEDPWDELAIPISIRPASRHGIDFFDTEDGLGDNRMRIASIKKHVATDPEMNKRELKEIEPKLLAFLYIVDFLQYAPGEVSLIIEEEQAAKGGFLHCGISLRYINQFHYARVHRFLLTNETRLISGTLLNARMIAANLLLPISEIEYIEASVQLHSSVLIIVHNPKSIIEPRPAEIPPWAMTDLYSKIQASVVNVKILHFATNSTIGKDYFKSVCDDNNFLNQFKVERYERDEVAHDPFAAYENTKERPAILTIDKLRSSTSRAVNRNSFDICVVFGNGIANWDDRIALFHQAKKTDPSLSLGDFVQFEQLRSVIQAVMRAPRSAKKTVCLYVGNLHKQAFPKFMQNRIITTQEICKIHNLDEKLEPQINGIVCLIQQFRNGEKIVIPKTETKIEDTIIKQWDGRSDAIEGRMAHIEICLSHKGYIDRVQDKKGERPDWIAFLDSLVEQGYLANENRGKKSVYVKSNVSV